MSDNAVNKARYWCGVLYPENMRDGWEMDIGDIIQLPYAYCIHDADVTSDEEEERKVHVHVIVAFSNTTTKKHAVSVFNLLSADGKKAFSSIKAVISIRGMYDYLIHDTETCRKKGKHLYPPECRITGNNFDIGAYEQLSIAEKNDMCKELCDIIMKEGFTDFGLFYMYVMSNFEDTNYFEIIKSHSGLFERLTKSNYQRAYLIRMHKEDIGNGGDISAICDPDTGEIYE